MSHSGLLGKESADLPEPRPPEPRRSAVRIPWSSELTVGHRLIDQDHQTLVELVNELVRLHRDGESAEVAEVLGQLLDHTAWHFHREEVLMMARAYPDIARHRQEHASLLAQLQGLQARFLDGDRDVAGTIAESVAQWFLGHATTHDHQLGRFLRRAV